MGNNNQEPLSNKLGVGLYSADGPLYLWHDFLNLAINQAWDWNGHAPRPTTTSSSRPAWSWHPSVASAGCRRPVPAGRPSRFRSSTERSRHPTTCMSIRRAGLVPRRRRIPTARARFQVSGTCFDVVAEVAQDGRRPREMVAAAARWADRFVNGEWGAKGSSSQIGVLGPDQIWLQIAPVLGNSGFGAPICGTIRATPTPVPTPQSSGGGGGGGCGPGKPGNCTPAPTPVALSNGAPIQPTGLVAMFAVPAILGTVPLAARAGRWGRRRLRCR